MPNTIKSFSQALAFLEIRGAVVQSVGRDNTWGALRWNVDGQLLEKHDVIGLAQQLQKAESEAEYA